MPSKRTAPPLRDIYSLNSTRLRTRAKDKKCHGIHFASLSLCWWRHTLKWERLQLQIPCRLAAQCRTRCKIWPTAAAVIIIVINAPLNKCAARVVSLKTKRDNAIHASTCSMAIICVYHSPFVRAAELVESAKRKPPFKCNHFISFSSCCCH